MLRDIPPYAVANLLHRKMRSWLTMIGIFIGIAAVVALISLGQGLRNAIDIQFEKLGTDNLFVQPEGGFGDSVPAYLYDADVNVIKQTSGVRDVLGSPFKTERLEWKGKPYYGYMYGVPLDQIKFWDAVFTFDVIDGRKLRSSDRCKVVIGYGLSTPDVHHPLLVGDKMLIGGISFDVVGIYEKVGDPTNDYAVFIPEDVYREITGIPDRVDWVVAKVEPGQNVTAVAERITKELRKHRGLEEGKEDFIVMTPDDLIEAFNTILDIVITVLVGIAAISLLVGGIGIMNTMYTAVLERTREIGIMKSIGAQNHDIFIIFLVESGLLGLLGGAIGVALGMGASKIVEFVVRTMLGPDYLSISFQPWLILGALAFAFVVGAISGVTPAWQASKMRPVDALAK